MINKKNKPQHLPIQIDNRYTILQFVNEMYYLRRLSVRLRTPSSSLIRICLDAIEVMTKNRANIFRMFIWIILILITRWEQLILFYLYENVSACYGYYFIFIVNKIIGCFVQYNFLWTMISMHWQLHWRDLYKGKPIRL